MLQSPPGTVFEAAARARAVADEVAAPLVERTDSGLWPEEAMRALQAAGLAGLVVPLEHGGAGLGLRAVAGVCETPASVCASTAICFGMHQVAAAALSTKATDKQATDPWPEEATDGPGGTHLDDASARRSAEQARDALSDQVAMMGRVSEALVGTRDPDEAVQLIAAEVVPTLGDWVAAAERGVGEQSEPSSRPRRVSECCSSTAGSVRWPRSCSTACSPSRRRRRMPRWPSATSPRRTRRRSAATGTTPTSSRTAASSSRSATS